MRKFKIKKQTFPAFKKRLALISLMITLFFSMIGLAFFNLFENSLFTFFSDTANLLLSWKLENEFVGVIIYMTFYISLVIFCLPGAAVLSIVGGYLFGAIYSVGYVVFSATVGGYIVFLWVRYSCPAFLRAKKINLNGHKFFEGLKKNALPYLLFLRLVPIFPFWLINLVPAIFGISSRTYLIATFFGIIPSTVIYCRLGDKLNLFFLSQDSLEVATSFDFEILALLGTLALLSLFPVFYKKR